MRINRTKNAALEVKLPNIPNWERAVIDKMPHYTVSDGRTSKVCKWVYDNISSPEQRLFMGVTALLTQPFIDLNNKRVNEETRLMSFSRTIAKIIVGTTVGVLVRKGCIYTAKNLTKLNENDIQGNNVITNAKKYARLLPKKISNYTPERHKEYINTLGTIMGLGAMIFTNFLIDAPLTQILTNIFYKHLNNKGENDEHK